MLLHRAERVAAGAAHAGTIDPLYNPDGLEPARRPTVMMSVGSEDPILAAGLVDHTLPLPTDPTLFTTHADFRDRVVAPTLRLAAVADTYEYRATETPVPSGELDYVGVTNRVRLFLIQGLAHEYPSGENGSFPLAQHAWDTVRDVRLP